MKRSHTGNVLLVELLIVILFFMLGSVILVQVFGKAHEMNTYADTLAEAVLEAQSAADTLYAAGEKDLERTLADMEFTEESPGMWVRPGERFSLYAAASEEPAGYGTMRRMEVKAVAGEETLLALPCSRYITAGETP